MYGALCKAKIQLSSLVVSSVAYEGSEGRLKASIWMLSLPARNLNYVKADLLSVSGRILEDVRSRTDHLRAELQFPA